MCERTPQVSSCPHQQEQVASVLHLVSCPGWRSCGLPGQPGQTPSWGLHILSLWHPFSKLCPCALPAGAHGDSPVPSSFLSPPQQPLADAHCWFSLWCLIPPLVKWWIIAQRYHCHNALKSSETWKVDSPEIMKNKPHLSSSGTVAVFTCYFKQNFLIVQTYEKIYVEKGLCLIYPSLYSWFYLIVISTL